MVMSNSPCAAHLREVVPSGVDSRQLSVNFEERVTARVEILSARAQLFV